MAGASSHVRARAFSVVHRYGAVSPAPDGVYAVGVRCDEEQPELAESTLLFAAAGRVSSVLVMGGEIKALAAFEGGLVVVDGAGAVRLLDRSQHKGAGTWTTHALPAVDAASLLDAALVLCSDGRVWRVDAEGAVPVARVPGVGKKIAADLSAAAPVVVVLTDEGAWRLTLEGQAEVRGKVLPVEGVAASDLDCVAVGTDADGNTLVVAAMNEVVLAGVDRLRVISRAKAPVDSVAVFGGVVYAGSRRAGLMRYDASLPALVSLRPSLRAHHLAVGRGVFAVASDLFTATTSDGEEIYPRDLSSFVRMNDGRRPSWLEEATADER